MDDVTVAALERLRSDLHDLIQDGADISEVVDSIIKNIEPSMEALNEVLDECEQVQANQIAAAKGIFFQKRKDFQRACSEAYEHFQSMGSISVAIGEPDSTILLMVHKLNPGVTMKSFPKEFNGFPLEVQKVGKVRPA